MLFGKIKGSTEYGFGLDKERFDSFIEIDDNEHMKLYERANSENKKITADKDGNPILVDPPPLSEKVVNQNRLNELESYLEHTDWYVIRYADTGAAIPSEIKQKRQEAREEISALRVKLVEVDKSEQ